MDVTNIVRKMLWQGPVVSWKVPKGAIQGEVPDTDITFWQFAISAVGGVVNVFAHTGEDIRGQQLAFALQIWNKQLSCGRWFNYVDLHPSQEPVTHRLAVLDTRRFAAPEDAVVFAAGCFNHKAQIAIFGKDEKLVEQTSPDTVVVHSEESVSNPFAALAALKE